jgi:hypothetical protein
MTILLYLGGCFAVILLKSWDLCLISFYILSCKAINFTINCFSCIPQVLTCNVIIWYEVFSSFHCNLSFGPLIIKYVSAFIEIIFSSYFLLISDLCALWLENHSFFYLGPLKSIEISIIISYRMMSIHIHTQYICIYYISNIYVYVNYISIYINTYIHILWFEYKMSLTGSGIELLVPSWWCYLGRFWKL